MKGRYYILLYAVFVIINHAEAKSPRKPVQETNDGVIVYPEFNLSGNTKAVKLQVVSDRIIRVIASPAEELPPVKSLITVYGPAVKNWTLMEKADRVILKTPALTATVLLSTGAVSFADKTGKLLLAERQHSGRSFSPAVFEGQQSYGITQVFETTADDAYYGLGQHQAGQYNYKGQQVFLFQNNTEVAIPFLVSRKNYGILWDNYSLTKVGDTREFMPLSRLKLYSKEGDSGWLTASYCNKPGEIAFTNAESKIDYPYLDDAKKNLPAAFQLQDGTVTWEGAIASDFEGIHKFRITYGGYAKVWIDGRLLTDNWRQSWNPGSAILDLPLRKNKRYPVKIEWKPDGTESYFSVNWLDPIPEADQHAFSFSSEAGKQLDYYFIHGNSIDDVIGGYRIVTGNTTIVPKWAMGFWQSRERYKTQSEILQTVAEFRKRKIPLDNIVLDWSYWKEDEWGSQEFDKTRFSDPDSMIRVLHHQYQVYDFRMA